MDNLKSELAKTSLLVNDKTSWKDAKDVFLLLFDTMTDTMETNANAVTDLAEAVEKYEAVIEEKDRKITDLQEKVRELEKRKDSQEVKDSQAEMALEIRQAMTTFKVMDLDMEKETDDRKEIIDSAAKAINSKIRSDVKSKWIDATRAAKVIPIGRKTTKRNVEGKDIMTVPVLIRIEDKDSRWQAEEALRQSKLHPAFHWPQSMLGYIKKFRKDLTDNGVDENDYYIRIRPEDRNGKLKIRGDIKRKSGGKFEPKAYWNVPAADSVLNESNTDIETTCETTTLVNDFLYNLYNTFSANNNLWLSRRRRG
jgi:hypothetical protein